jgi:hypothetical protein
MANDAAVPATPEVANIAQPGAAPETAAVPGLDEAFAQAQATLNAPMPSQIIQGTDQAQPHMPAALPQYEPKSTDNRPMGPTLGDKKRAAIKNDFAAMGNALGKAVQGYEQRKQDTLKDQIVTVMKAKQQVANANSVLQMPGATQEQKDLANKVLAANTKRINDVMSDPKDAKQMAKAFDVSYSDPDKNKTPEVAAGLAAHKEFQAAGPHTADNPQEAAVAKLAQGGQQAPAQKTPSGAPVFPAQTPPKVQSISQANPRAAAVLAKDMPSIEANPQYAAALKQKEDAQKQYMTLAPHVIDAQAKASVAAYNAGNAAARLQYKATTDMQRSAYEAAARAQNVTTEAKAAMARVIQEGANQQRDIMAHAEAAMGISSNPALNAEVKQHLGNTAITALDTSMDTLTKNQLALEVENNTQGTSADQITQNNIIYQFNATRLKQLAAQRANMQAQFFPDVTGQSAADRAAEAAGKVAGAAPAKGKNGNTQQQSAAANDQRSNPSAADLAEARRQAAATQTEDDGSLADQY